MYIHIYIYIYNDYIIVQYMARPGQGPGRPPVGPALSLV